MFSSLLRDMVHANQVYSNDNRGRVYQNCKFHDRNKNDYSLL